MLCHTPGSGSRAGWQRNTDAMQAVPAHPKTSIHRSRTPTQLVFLYIKTIVNWSLEIVVCQLQMSSPEIHWDMSLYCFGHLRLFFNSHRTCLANSTPVTPLKISQLLICLRINQADPHSQHTSRLLMPSQAIGAFHQLGLNSEIADMLPMQLLLPWLSTRVDRGYNT